MKRLSFALLLLLLLQYSAAGIAAIAALLGRLEILPAQPPNLRLVSHDFQLAWRPVALLISAIGVMRATARVTSLFWCGAFANTLLNLGWFCFGYLLSPQARYLLWAIQAWTLVIGLLLILVRQWRDGLNILDPFSRNPSMGNGE